MAEREQVLLEHGFVLHQRPYRDSSQLLECVTANHGRVGLVARGSRRTGNRQRAFLQPFAPLRLSWLRRGELGRLTGVEPEAMSYTLAAQHLLAGFYANELLLRLTARSDPNSQVFSCYSRCLARLAAAEHVARTLRVFELHLLDGARLRRRARKRCRERRTVTAQRRATCSSSRTACAARSATIRIPTST